MFNDMHAKVELTGSGPAMGCFISDMLACLQPWVARGKDELLQKNVNDFIVKTNLDSHLIDRDGFGS